MECSTGGRCRQRQWVRLLHIVAILAVLLMTAKGESRGSWAGVVCYRAHPVGVWCPRRGRKAEGQALRWGLGRAWMRRSWVVMAIRSEVLLVWAILGGHPEWRWLCLLPWLEWLWKGVGVVWPSLRRQALYSGMSRLVAGVYRLAFVGLGACALVQGVRSVQSGCVYRTSLALGSVGSASSVEVEQDEEGTYHVHL